MEDIGGVWSRTSEILADHVFKLFERTRFDVQFPVKVLAHLALHLVDLSELEHALADNRPGLVRVGVVAYHL